MSRLDESDAMNVRALFALLTHPPHSIPKKQAKAMIEQHQMSIRHALEAGQPFGKVAEAIIAAERRRTNRPQHGLTEKGYPFTFTVGEA